jgi:hypothetical protein
LVSDYYQKLEVLKRLDSRGNRGVAFTQKSHHTNLTLSLALAEQKNNLWLEAIFLVYSHTDWKAP